MSQIEELQSRITAAMDRIGAGIVTLAEQQSDMRANQTEEAETAADTGAAADLAQALDEEKLANAQLEERLKAIKTRHAEEIESLRAELANSEELDSLKAEMAALKAELDNAADAEALEAEKAETARLTGALEAQQTEVARLTAEMADTAATDALKAELEKQTAEVARLTAELADSAVADALTAELETQKAEVARLTAELASQETVVDKFKAEFDRQSTATARLDMDVQRLRQSNDQLREANAALREVNEQSVGEPHLINKAMLAELEGLRAARATDMAEAGAVLARLEPLLASAANLPEGEED